MDKAKHFDVDVNVLGYRAVDELMSQEDEQRLSLMRNLIIASTRETIDWVEKSLASRAQVKQSFFRSWSTR